MSLVAAFMTMSFNTASADSATVSVTPDAYFDYKSTTTAKFENDNAVFTLTESDTIKVENTIAVNDLMVNFKASEGVESVKVTTNAKSYIVNGNKFVKEDESVEFVTDIINTVAVNVKDGTARLNSKDLTTATAGKVFMKTDNNGYYSASVDGENYVAETDSYYRVKTSNAYNVLTGKVEIEVTLKEGVTSASFEIISLSQKASSVTDADKSFLQTFKPVEGKIVEADPVISLTESTKVSEDKAILYNVKTKVLFNVYSFLDGYTKSDMELVADDAWVNESENGEVRFDAGDDQVLKVANKESDKVYLSIKLNVLDKRTVTSDAPKYTYNAEAMESFLAAFEKRYTKVDDNGEKHSVALGSTIEIPSLEDFVSDDYTVYGDLKVEVYYATPNASAFGTKSEMKLTLSYAGEYKMFVLFKDAEGNKMAKGDFIVDGKDGVEDTVNLNTDSGKYFVFDFALEDDAPIEVTPAKVQGKGYRGTRYTASKFTVDATGCNVTYKLFYNASSDAKEDSEGWMEIPTAATIVDTDYVTEDGYDYETIQKIAYNGTLTFTPDKIGAYMIECTATSKTTSKQESAVTIIKIEAEPSVVRPASDWLENNVWSVVFLSVGSLCLIGIIVLLCIKPKEENKD